VSIVCIGRVGRVALPLMPACIVSTEGAPSLRFLQGWGAMLPGAPFHRSDHSKAQDLEIGDPRIPWSAALTASNPFAKSTKEWGTFRGISARFGPGPEREHST